MEEDALVRIVFVVVVPVEACGGLLRCEMEGEHSDGVADIEFAAGGNAAVVEFAQQHAGGDFGGELQVVPAAEADGVQRVLFDKLIDGDGGLRQ